MYHMTPQYFAGVVGSRRRNTLHDRRIVNALMDWLIHKHERLVLVSGGCQQGADAFAEEAADLCGILKLIFPIDKKGATSRWDFTRLAYERNKVVAQNSTAVYALVAEDRKGGTENTVEHALKLQKPVYLITNSGEVYLSEDGTLPKCEPVARLLDSKYTD